jgi:hypothetical protein
LPSHQGYDTTPSRYQPETGKTIKSNGEVYEHGDHLERNDWGAGGQNLVIELLKGILDEQRKQTEIMREAFDA